ncbi:unnamed protein product [Rotaria sp. Silwood1]|nr:unnamed protein product [Rotaria sp. Silwood1]
MDVNGNKIMRLSLMILFSCFILIDGKHFNGGTIDWAPINPYDNSSSVKITITQSYSWTYPYVQCSTNVPISTSTFSGANTNLICMADCSTDGGYSSAPIDILTDCTSASSSLKMMTSERSKTITLSSDAHFYLAYQGTAWVSLDDPPEKGLQWSITTYIDLRKRPDGFINTPPVAKVISPQYAIVNRATQINIPVSDANTGDDVRCRWSTYTAGYRRRKRSNDEGRTTRKYSGGSYKKLVELTNDIQIRRKRFWWSNPCDSRCAYNCPCSDATCVGTNCGSSNCPIWDFWGGCTATTAPPTTTTETLGTLKTTLSYANRQAIDECGGICYPNSVPSGTSLSNCIISFTGLKSGIWYAVSVQVEDFISTSSTTPMSSVPVQLLIYVMPEPSCSTKPIIIPLSRCLEAQVGISLSFNLYVMNLCDPNVATLADLVVSSDITGMTKGNLINSATNTSLSYVTFTWTPQANQVGEQQLCTIAYTDEQVQSDQYCVTFTVKTSEVCITTTTTTTTTTTATTTTKTTSTSTTSTTTTTSTATTTTTTTSTSTTSTTTTTTSVTTTTTTTSTTSTTTTTSTATTTTSTTSTSTTSTTTTTTSVTTTTTTTSTTTTTTTSTTTTATTTTTTTGSTTSTTTSTTSTTSTSSTSTSSTTTSSSTTSTTSTSTSTTTTSVTTTTSTSTTTTTATTTTATTTQASASPINWLLILGISLLALLLALCLACCCLYRYCWGPAARRRRRKGRERSTAIQAFETQNISDMTWQTQSSTRTLTTTTSRKISPTYKALNSTNSMNNDFVSDSHIKLCDETPLETMNISTNVEENRPRSLVSIKRIKRNQVENIHDSEKTNEIEDAEVKPFDDRDDKRAISNVNHSAFTHVGVSRLSKLDQKHENGKKSPKVTDTKSLSASAMSRSKTGRISVKRVSRQKTATSPQALLSNIYDDNLVHLAKPTMKVQPIKTHSKTASTTINGIRNKSKGVVVTKLSRKLITAHAHRS